MGLSNNDENAQAFIGITIGFNHHHGNISWHGAASPGGCVTNTA